MKNQVRRALPEIRQDCLECREVSMNIGYDRYPHIALCRNSILATTCEEDHDSRMSQHSGLGKYNIIGFVSIVDVPRAKDFYQNTLGLRLVMEEPPFALVFDANGIMLRLGMAKKLPPAHGTVLGWQVPEIAATVKGLGQAGVRFERYEGMNQDELGIWTSPTGAKVAWFRDPDGNILSVSEHPELKK
jgi:catechol 2,3-dioxygenase-like lactoylglutathione lyase family enzyme